MTIEKRIAQRFLRAKDPSEVRVNIPAVEGAETKQEAEKKALKIVPGKVVYTEEYKDGAWFVWIKPRTASTKTSSGGREVVRFVDDLLNSGKDWEYKVWGRGIRHVKVTGDNESFQIFFEAPTVTGWDGDGKFYTKSDFNKFKTFTRRQIQDIESEMYGWMGDDDWTLELEVEDKDIEMKIRGEGDGTYDVVEEDPYSYAGWKTTIRRSRNPADLLHDTNLGSMKNVSWDRQASSKQAVHLEEFHARKARGLPTELGSVPWTQKPPLPSYDSTDRGGRLLIPGMGNMSTKDDEVVFLDRDPIPGLPVAVRVVGDPRFRWKKSKDSNFYYQISSDGRSWSKKYRGPFPYRRGIEKKLTQMAYWELYYLAYTQGLIDEGGNLVQEGKVKVPGM